MSHFREPNPSILKPYIIKVYRWKQVGRLWGLRRVLACSRSVWDLLLAESDPVAWPLSRTQQDAGTHTHTYTGHVHGHKRRNTRTVFTYMHVRTLRRAGRSVHAIVSLPMNSFLATRCLEYFRHRVLPPASPEFCLPTWCLKQQVHPLRRCLDTSLMNGSLNLPVVLCMLLTHCPTVFLCVCVCVVWRREPSSWRTSSRRAPSVCTGLTPCSRTCYVSYITPFFPLCLFLSSSLQSNFLSV